MTCQHCGVTIYLNADGGWEHAPRTSDKNLPCETPEPDDDTIPAVLSPGRSTTPRPGETHLEAMDRLMEGEDL